MSKRTVCNCGAALDGHAACWNCGVPCDGSATAASTKKTGAKKKTSAKKRTAKK